MFRECTFLKIEDCGEGGHIIDTVFFMWVTAVIAMNSVLLLFTVEYEKSVRQSGWILGLKRRCMSWSG